MEQPAYLTWASYTVTQ